MSSPNVHPKFTVTRDQLRVAFNEHEALGERQRRVSFGVTRTADLTEPGQEGFPPQLSVVFMPPIAQAAVEGYRFGFDRRKGIPDNRNAEENRIVDDIIAHLNEISFRVFVEPTQDRTVDVPAVDFVLISNAGEQIQPNTAPTSLIFEGRDVVAAAALAERGLALAFPLFSGGPVLTDDMTQFTLVVRAGGDDQELIFPL
jgi:hypothetical protein